MGQKRRLAANWKIGDLAYIPKVPLSFYSRIGDTSFWKLGIIIDIIDGWVFLWDQENMQKVHIDVLRRIQL